MHQDAPGLQLLSRTELEKGKDGKWIDAPVVDARRSSLVDGVPQRPSAVLVDAMRSPAGGAAKPTACRSLAVLDEEPSDWSGFEVPTGYKLAATSYDVVAQAGGRTLLEVSLPHGGRRHQIRAAEAEQELVRLLEVVAVEGEELRPPRDLATRERYRAVQYFTTVVHFDCNVCQCSPTFGMFFWKVQRVQWFSYVIKALTKYCKTIVLSALSKENIPNLLYCMQLLKKQLY